MKVQTSAGMTKNADGSYEYKGYQIARHDAYDTGWMVGGGAHRFGTLKEAAANIDQRIERAERERAEREAFAAKLQAIIERVYALYVATGSELPQPRVYTNQYGRTEGHLNIIENGSRYEDCCLSMHFTGGNCIMSFKTSQRWMTPKTASEIAYALDQAAKIHDLWVG